MLRSILSRVAGGRGRTTGLGTTTGRATGRPTTTGRSGVGGSANRDIEQGARSLLRGFGRKRRGL